MLRFEVLLMSLAKLKEYGRLVNIAVSMWVCGEGVEYRGHDQIASSLQPAPKRTGQVELRQGQG